MNTKSEMSSKPVLPLLLKMSLPPMLSMLIQSLYNVVDSMYVAYLGEEALTAISLAFPLQNLSLSVAVGLGIGINALIARSLGAKDNHLVNVYASSGLFLVLCHSALFIFIGIFLTEPFFAFFTNNALVYHDAVIYGRIVLVFAFGQHLHLLIEKMFQATGNMIIPMFLQLAGACVNLLLDPILIFGWFGIPALGITGAAIATIVGQLCSCALAFAFFHHREKNIHFSKQDMNVKSMKQIYSIAIPSAILMSLSSVLVSALNALLNGFSQSAVAFFGVYYKLQTFIYMPAAGIIQGMRPLVAYNYGAKLYDRVHKIIHTSIACVGVIMLTGTCLFMFLPTWILSMFQASEAMYSIGVIGLRILSISFVCATIGFTISGVFEALGKGLYSMGVSICRQFIVTLLFAYVGSYFFGIEFIWISVVLGECVGSAIAFGLYKHMHIQK